MKNLIATKNHRPIPSRDTLLRPELFGRLDSGAEKNLTLISAPAGYGKSVTVSTWLQQSTIKYAWLSLSKGDDELLLFFQYVIAAVTKVFPDTCYTTSLLLTAEHELEPDKIAESIINDLEAIDDSFVLVLEDYGYIHSQEIHDVIDTLIQFCPRKLQLLITTRRDPPFSLKSLRAAGKMVELRQRDLMFSEAETILFFNNTIGRKIENVQASIIAERIEGWAAGLRLLSLALAGKDISQSMLRELLSDPREITEYLMAEVLANQPENIRQVLLATSILRRFNNKIIQHLVPPARDNSDILTYIIEANLFCIPLDHNEQWYRYHHLFQDLLLYRLHLLHSDEDVRELHREAAVWFDENGISEEAVHHYLEIGDSTSAYGVLETHSRELMNYEHWSRLNRLVKLLPQNQKLVQTPGVLIARAFLAENRFRHGESLDLIEKLESLYLDPVSKSCFRDTDVAQLNALLAMKYFFLVDGEKSRASARKALSMLPENYSSARGFAHVLSALAGQLLGDSQSTLKELTEALTSYEFINSTLKGRILLGFCFIYWLSGDLENLKSLAVEYYTFAISAHLKESQYFALYFLGLTNYQTNNIAEAEINFNEARTNDHYLNINSFAHCLIMLAMVRARKGEYDAAMQITEQLVKTGYDLANEGLLMLAKAFKAELALELGRKKLVNQWLSQLEPDQVSPVFRMYTPYITEVKATLLVGEERELEQLGVRLAKFLKFFSETHNIPMLINLYAVAAVLSEKEGKKKDADRLLNRSIALASPGRFINIFRGLGPEFPELLHRQFKSSINPDYLKLLSENVAPLKQPKETAPPHGQSIPKRSISDPGGNGLLLSNREFEILTLLANRYTNKEIANELFISVNTVKRHAVNIYNKVGAHGRQEAVARARDLNLIP